MSFRIDLLLRSKKRDTLSPEIFKRAATNQTDALQLRPANDDNPKWKQVITKSSFPASKSFVDTTLAALLLLGILPGLLAIALGIKLTSPGPVLFKQRRYGFKNRLFEIYKFRTMHFSQEDGSGVTQTRPDDPRITPFGRFLRRSSLDELPQLLNVVKGDMSLVGPRPHVPGMLAGGVQYEHLVPYYFERHRIKPGITGLAQVRGYRGSTENSEAAIARVDHDLEYIQNWSHGLDFKILLKTAHREFLSGTGI